MVHENCQRKGKLLTDNVQLAAQLVSQGIQAAQQSQRYAHLVYNGSVKMWHAVRPLMRTGRWMNVHGPLATTFAALKELDGHVLWKATFASALAQCEAAV